MRCSLEELCHGVTKRLRIHRIAAGSGEREAHTIEAVIQPGWKEGTRMTFAGHGDQLLGRQPQDVVLTLREKPHERFRRSGADLTAELTLDPAQSGHTELVGIDGATVRVPIPELVRHRSQVSVPGAGLPVRAGGKLTGARGALRVTFKLEHSWPTPAAAAEGRARERGQWRGAEPAAGGEGAAAGGASKTCVVCMDGPREAVICHGTTAHTYANHHPSLRLISVQSPLI